MKFTAAYKKAALRCHPDKCQEQGAEDAFCKLRDAFSVLSDPQLREVYNAELFNKKKATKVPQYYGGMGPRSGPAREAAEAARRAATARTEEEARVADMMARQCKARPPPSERLKREMEERARQEASRKKRWEAEAAAREAASKKRRDAEAKERQRREEANKAQLAAEETRREEERKRRAEEQRQQGRTSREASRMSLGRPTSERGSTKRSGSPKGTPRPSSARGPPPPADAYLPRFMAAGPIEPRRNIPTPRGDTRV